MRLNQYLARHTDLSRRKADQAIKDGRVEINGVLARLGDTVIESDRVTLDSHSITTLVNTVILLLNKPAGYVCSRNGQGSKTVYDLLPSEYHHLNPVGRLDKDSSGLLLMTNDGELANQLTHPRYQKLKKYIVTLQKPLEPPDYQEISTTGVQLEDGPSKLGLVQIRDNGQVWEVSMSEGRNRQIRRTFEALGYRVVSLHRTVFGSYQLGSLPEGKYAIE